MIKTTLHLKDRDRTGENLRRRIELEQWTIYFFLKNREKVSNHQTIELSWLKMKENGSLRSSPQLDDLTYEKRAYTRDRDKRLCTSNSAFDVLRCTSSLKKKNITILSLPLFLFILFLPNVNVHIRDKLLLFIAPRRSFTPLPQPTLVQRTPVGDWLTRMRGINLLSIYFSDSHKISYYYG
jgi:hypothetical protein